MTRAKRNTTTIICRQCGEAFEGPAPYRGGGFCSHRCYGAAKTVPWRERFWGKVERGDGCWLWRGTLDPTGYGVFWIDGQNRRAHRLSYILAHGPIADGLFVCHRCDNPRCVNPEHLFLGTPGENTADAKAKGRMATGERQGCAKLRDTDIPPIREALSRHESTFRIAERFGVSQKTIMNIKQGRVWKHV